MKNIKLVLKLSALTVAVAMVAGCNDGSSSASSHHSSGIGYDSTAIVLTNGVKTSELFAANNTSGATDQDDIHASKTINISYNDDPVTLHYHVQSTEFPQPKNQGSCTPASGSDGNTFEHCASYEVSFVPSNTDQSLTDELDLQVGSYKKGSISVSGSVPVRLFENSIPDIDATLDSYTLVLSAIDKKNHLQFNIDNLDLNSMKDNDSSLLTAKLDPDAKDEVAVTTKDVLRGLFSHFGYNPGDDASTWTFTSKSGETSSIHTDYNSVRSFEITTDKGNIYNQDLFAANAPTQIKVETGSPKQTKPISVIVANKSIQNFVMNRSGMSTAVVSYWDKKKTISGYAVTADGAAYDLFGKTSTQPLANKGSDVLATNMFHIKDPDDKDDDSSILYSASFVKDNTGKFSLKMHTSDLDNRDFKPRPDVNITVNFPGGATPTTTSKAVMAISNNQTYDNSNLAYSSNAAQNDLNILLYIDGNLYGGKIPTIVASQNPTTPITLFKVVGQISNAIIYREHTYDSNNKPMPETTHQAQYLLTITAGGVVQLYDPNSNSPMPAVGQEVANVTAGLTPLSFSCNEQSVNKDSPIAPICYLAAKDGANLAVYKFSDFKGTKTPFGATTVSSSLIAGKGDANQVVVDGDTGSLAVLDSTSAAVNIYKAADSYTKAYSVSLGANEHATGIYDY